MIQKIQYPNKSKFHNSRAQLQQTAIWWAESVIKRWSLLVDLPPSRHNWAFLDRLTRFVLFSVDFNHLYLLPHLIHSINTNTGTLFAVHCLCLDNCASQLVLTDHIWLFREFWPWPCNWANSFVYSLTSLKVDLHASDLEG